MKKYAGILLNTSGLPSAGAIIQVVQTGTQVLAALFDRNNQQIANPLTTDAGGQYAFRVRSGVYDLLDSNNQLLAEGLQIFDFTNPGEWLGVWDFPKTGFKFGGPGSLNVYALSNTVLATDAGMRIGGAQHIDDDTLVVVGPPNNTGFGDLIQVLVSPGQEPMYRFDTQGALHFGPGGGFTTDVKLYRSAGQELRTDGSFVVDDKLEHKGALLGFFGAPPLAQQVINAGTLSLPANQALYDLLVALAKTGIIGANYTVTAVGTMAINVDMTATRFVNATAENTVTTTMTGVGTVS